MALKVNVESDAERPGENAVVGVAGRVVIDQLAAPDKLVQVVTPSVSSRIPWTHRARIGNVANPHEGSGPLRDFLDPATARDEAL
ncbi:MAG: hypothetical protein JOZ99_06700 [Actinobacteria bacterium]|nr:hypothetical protein [Actinomycetota bacterium]